MDGEVRVVVARAHIEASPEIDGKAPKEIRVRTNAPLRVQYLYHVEETAHAHKAWRFMLQSNIGVQAKQPVRSHRIDRWGLPDDFWGLLEQTFTFEKAGVFPAAFKVDALFDRTRLGPSGHTEVRRALAGCFLVRVHT